MKGKNPTVKQCKELTKYGLNYNDYLIQKNTDKMLQLIHRNTGKITRIDRVSGGVIR